MLDTESPVPLYEQLKAILRRRIEAGEYAPNEALPPERELIGQYNVSRITVRQALADLEAEGLLVRRHGKGTFVAPRTPGLIAESLGELTGHLEELQLRGLDPQVELLASGHQVLPPDATAGLELPPGATGWSMYRLVSVQGSPLMLSEVCLPASLNLAPDPTTVKRVGMAQYLQEQGLFPTKGHQRIGATAAGVAEAGLLTVQAGDPLLRVIRVIADPAGRPLVWFRTLYRADRYEYEVQLKRRR